MMCPDFENLDRIDKDPRIFKECKMCLDSVRLVIDLAGTLSDVSEVAASEGCLLAMALQGETKTYAEPTAVKLSPVVRVNLL